MFENNILNQEGMIKSLKSDKNIVLTMPLLMKLLEWSHESVQSDEDLHKVMEKIISFTDGINPLTFDTFELIIADVKSNEYANDEDMTSAYDLGQRQAENGMDLTNDLTRNAASMITAMKDNGYGASNDEIEQFCQGYEDNQGIDICSIIDGMNMGCVSGIDGTDLTQDNVVVIPGDNDCCCIHTNDCELDDETNNVIQRIIQNGRL